MAAHVCPPWIGYFLLNPLRKLVENPRGIFEPFVREGMTVLEPGCAMGFFTLPLARMVGPSGRVVALGSDVAFVDVGGKGEATIDLEELGRLEDQLECILGPRLLRVLLGRCHDFGL